MDAILAALLLGVAGLGYRALLAFEKVAAQKHELATRHLQLEEKRAAAALEPEELPVDLQMRVNRETEVWAREQVRAVITELFVRHKDWAAVRTELDRLDRQANGAPTGWSQTEVSL